jgi:hypothetical protein
MALFDFIAIAHVIVGAYTQYSGVHFPFTIIPDFRLPWMISKGKRFLM